MSRPARLGAFIVATLAILAAGVFIVGSKQYLFTSTYQVKAQFANVAGLDSGADVRVGGVHSGTVRSIELPHKTGDKVTVIMDLSKSTHEIIKQDSDKTSPRTRMATGVQSAFSSIPKEPRFRAPRYRQWQSLPLLFLVAHRRPFQETNRKLAIKLSMVCKGSFVVSRPHHESPRRLGRNPGLVEWLTRSTGYRPAN